MTITDHKIPCSVDLYNMYNQVFVACDLFPVLPEQVTNGYKAMFGLVVFHKQNIFPLKLLHVLTCMMSKFTPENYIM